MKSHLSDANSQIQMATCEWMDQAERLSIQQLDHSSVDPIVASEVRSERER